MKCKQIITNININKMGKHQKRFIQQNINNIVYLHVYLCI